MLAIIALSLAGQACARGDKSRALPPPVQLGAPRTGTPLGDAQFTPHTGGKAYYGELNGGLYRIEVPDNWNHQLVLYLHGDHETFATLTVDSPPIDDLLIRNGYAWGATSYDTNRVITGIAADETAALWDFFATKFGRPSRTFLIGESMGGAGAVISAERYADRYDGALSICGIVDDATAFDIDGDMFVTAAFVAGVTQAQYDASTPQEILATRITPALNDTATRDRFESLWIDLSGGPRPFDLEGLQGEESVKLAQGAQAIAVGLFDNANRSYELPSSGNVARGAFNANVIRVSAGTARKEIPDSEEASGDLQIPVVTLQTTGDFNVPLATAQILQRRADDQGKSALLVQRTVQDSGHCGLMRFEMDAAFHALVDWVTRGIKPDGEDVLMDNLQGLGRFTLAPRIGSAAAESLPSAGLRLTLSGRLTVGAGEPAPGLVSVLVEEDGLLTHCELNTEFPSEDLAYVRVAASSSEIAGCGKPGDRVFLAAQLGNSDFILGDESATWPADTTTLHLDASFSNTDPEQQLPLYFGSVFDDKGHHLGPGTLVEGVVAGTVCGRAVIPPVGRHSDGYELVMSRADPVCRVHEAPSFRVNGKPASRAQEAGRFVNLVVSS